MGRCFAAILGILALLVTLGLNWVGLFDLVGGLWSRQDTSAFKVGAVLSEGKGPTVGAATNTFLAHAAGSGEQLTKEGNATVPVAPTVSLTTTVVATAAATTATATTTTTTTAITTTATATGSLAATTAPVATSIALPSPADVALSARCKDAGAYAVSRPSQARPSVFVLVPGLGDPHHVPLVARGMEWLRAQDVRSGCVVYVYNVSLQISNNTDQLKPCNFIHSSGQWATFMREVPDQMFAGYDYVLLWLDDVTINGDLDLRWMVQVMRRNGLGAASLSYTAAESLGRWAPMHQVLNSGIGRYTDFIEFQFTLLTVSTFQCLRGMVDVHTNPRGWGLDLFFSTSCAGHCMGVLDTTTMSDGSRCSYDCDAAALDMRKYIAQHGEPPPKRTLGPLSAP